MTSQQWFYCFTENPHERFGPVAYDSLPKRPDTLMWTPGMSFWSPYIKGIPHSQVSPIVASSIMPAPVPKTNFIKKEKVSPKNPLIVPIKRRTRFFKSRILPQLSNPSTSGDIYRKLLCKIRKKRRKQMKTRVFSRGISTPQILVLDQKPKFQSLPEFPNLDRIFDRVLEANSNYKNSRKHPTKTFRFKSSVGPLYSLKAIKESKQTENQSINIPINKSKIQIKINLQRDLKIKTENSDFRTKLRGELNEENGEINSSLKENPKTNDPQTINGKMCLIDKRNEKTISKVDFSTPIESVENPLDSKGFAEGENRPNPIAKITKKPLKRSLIEFDQVELYLRSQRKIDDLFEALNNSVAAERSRELNHKGEKTTLIWELEKRLVESRDMGPDEADPFSASKFAEMEENAREILDHKANIAQRRNRGIRERKKTSLRASLRMGRVSKNTFREETKAEKNLNVPQEVNPSEKRYRIGVNLNTPEEPEEYNFTVWHSIFAIRMPEPFYNFRKTPGALRHLHSPLLRLGITQKENLIVRREEDEITAESNADPETFSDLSASEGNVEIFEYVEQHPFFIQKQGMASRLCLYRKVENKTDKELDTSTEKGVKLIKLGPNENPPLFGGMGGAKEILCLENNLFRAPTAIHKLSHNEYLAVRKGDSEWAMRKLSKIYTVGQEQPKRMIFAPTSTSAVEIIKSRISSVILETFMNASQKIGMGAHLCLSAKQLLDRFDVQYEQLAKDQIRVWAEYERGSQDLYSFKGGVASLNQNTIESLSSPDDICVIEAIREAEQKLHDLGITKITSISTEAELRIKQNSNESLKKIFPFLKKHLDAVPWNRCFTFQQAILRRCFLETHSKDGSLLNGELGFTMEKVRNRKTMTASKRIRRKSDEEDLRKIGVSEAKAVLTKMGVKSDELKGLCRWDLVALIRELAAEDEEYEKYSRAKASKKMVYSQEIESLFGQHLRFLSNKSEVQRTARELEDLFEMGPKKILGEELSSEENDEIDQTLLSLLPSGPQEALKEEATAAQNPSPAIKQRQKRYRRVTKKRMVLTVHKPVPGDKPVIEVITDRDRIMAYLNTKRQQRQKELEALPPLEREHIREEMEKVRTDQLQKLELNRKNELAREQRAIERSITKSHIRCSECGMRGHIKSNRSVCLKYQLRLKKEAEKETKTRLVDSFSGGKICIDTAKVGKVVSETKKKGLKRYIDLSKAIDEGLDLKKQDDHCMEFRNIIVSILGRVMKWHQKEANFFMKPIAHDNTVYYQTIRFPIDLGEILRRAENSSRPRSALEINAASKRKQRRGRKIARYTTIAEVYRDIELMYENTQIFFGRPKSSPVTTAALKLVNAIKKQLIKFKPQLEELSREIHEGEKEQRLLDHLKVVVQALKASRWSLYFREDPSYLPKYTEVIKTPMYIELVCKKVDDCRYADVEGFVQDCHLIGQNARAYNIHNQEAVRCAENLMHDGQVALEKEYEELEKLDGNARHWRISPLPKFRREEVVRADFTDFSSYQMRTPNNLINGGVREDKRKSVKKRGVNNRQRKKRIIETNPVSKAVGSKRPPGPSVFLE